MVLAAAVALLGCAHRSPSTTPANASSNKIELDPIVVTAGQERSELEGKTDGQLFDDGAVYFRAQKYQDAARHFDRLASAFPSSPQLGPALYNAGLAHQRLGHFQEALDRFVELIRREPGGRDGIDAQFQASLCEYKLTKKLEAAARLHALSARPGLLPQRKGEALVQEGVCRFEVGARSDGERLFREALKLFDEPSARESIDAALPAQAEFWLGEVYRSYFAEVKLDPVSMDQDKLAEQLESKAQFLLSAQGHYLRAIRRGDGEWATASGYKIGELYEKFHDELVAAPLPAGLDAGQAALYRDELRGKVKVLVGKAIRIYEQTLATAVRVGASNAYVDRARAALDRVKKLLLADDPTL